MMYSISTDRQANFNSFDSSNNQKMRFNDYQYFPGLKQVPGTDIYFGGRHKQSSKKTRRVSCWAVGAAVASVFLAGGGTAYKAHQASGEVNDARAAQNASVSGWLNTINDESSAFNNKVRLTNENTAFWRSPFRYEVKANSPERKKQLEDEQAMFQETLQLMLKGRPDLQSVLKQYPKGGFQLTVEDTYLLKGKGIPDHTLGAVPVTCSPLNVRIAGERLIDPQQNDETPSVRMTYIHEMTHIFDCLGLKPVKDKAKIHIYIAGFDSYLPGMTRKEKNRFNTERDKLKQRLADIYNHDIEDYTVISSYALTGDDEEFLPVTVSTFFRYPHSFQKDSPWLYDFYSKYFNVEPDMTAPKDIANDQLPAFVVKNRNYPTATMVPFTDYQKQLDQIQTRIDALDERQASQWRLKLLSDDNLKEAQNWEIRVLCVGGSLTIVFPTLLLLLNALYHRRKKHREEKVLVTVGTGSDSGWLSSLGKDD